MPPRTDSLGNPITLQDETSATALNDFVEGFIACEARAVNVLNAAADTSPIVQASCAALHMFAESADAPRNARPFIDQALAHAAEATEREQRFVAAIAAWVHGDLPRAIALHEEQARLHPRDLASLKLGQYHLFNRGDSPGMLRLALQALPAAAEVPYLHGMLAFGWEQCHRLPEADAAARHAISLCRKEPWAHHALAHVMLTQGRIREGTEFMASVSDTWTGLNSFMVTHNWWHQALFLLEQDRHAEVLALYDSQVWGVVKEYTQDQINAVSLLARLELAGVAVGDRWTDVADHLALRLADHVLPFLDLQYLYGLARAGRMEAARTLHNNIAAHAATRTEAQERTVWQQVCVPAAHGLLTHAQGDWATAVEKLGVALPRLVEIGGSHAQRDLFHQIWVDALQRNGQWAAVQNVLQPLVNAQPESVRLARQVGMVNGVLGLPVMTDSNLRGQMQVTQESRSAIARSRLFLKLAVECPADKRIEFEAFLEASIIFARAALHRFKTDNSNHPQWNHWWAGLRGNPSFEFFRTERDWLLKEASPKIGQRAFVRGIGRSPTGYEPSRAGEFYFFEHPDVPATDTVARHLQEVAQVLECANATFV